MSSLYVLLGGMYLLGGAQLVLALLAVRWLLTGRRPRFMTVTRFTAYGSAATTAVLTPMMITLTWNFTHAEGHRPPLWSIDLPIPAVVLAMGAVYVADRRGQARRTAQH